MKYIIKKTDELVSQESVSFCFTVNGKILYEIGPFKFKEKNEFYNEQEIQEIRKKQNINAKMDYIHIGFIIGEKYES